MLSLFKSKKNPVMASVSYHGATVGHDGTDPVRPMLMFTVQDSDGRPAGAFNIETRNISADRREQIVDDIQAALTGNANRQARYFQFVSWGVDLLIILLVVSWFIK